MARKALVVGWVVAVLFLTACQKEITEEALPEFCALSSITLRESSNGPVIARYSFGYDSLLRRPNLLQYQHYTHGVTRTIRPVYANDSIRLGADGFIALDRSKRVTLLRETNGLSGIDNGEYYYDYNTNGQLAQRTFDDGINDIKHTNYTYTNDSLSSVLQDYMGYQNSLTASPSYYTPQKLNGFGEYAFLEIFPELLLYMPCLKIGNAPLWPLSSVKTEIDVPSAPIPSYTTTYSNYTFTPEGWISSFETKAGKTGTPVSTIYEFDYYCFP